MQSQNNDLEYTVTALRDTLLSSGRMAHEFRVVRVIRDEEERVVVAYTETGLPSMFVLAQYSGAEFTYEHLREIDALNDFIIANRRLVGLEVDEFARNGIE